MIACVNIIVAFMYTACLLQHDFLLFLLRKSMYALDLYFKIL